MSDIPDLTDPRFLDEVGWFLCHEKYGRDSFGGSYDDERLAYSRMLMEEVLEFCEEDEEWLNDKSVLTIGCGCTGDLTVWPAAVKVAADPLLNVYRRLQLLVEDAGTSRTIYLAVTAEQLPLVDESTDIVICRNALDHMHDPATALEEIARVLKPDGRFFLDVDLGGTPTPDEPTVFSKASLDALLGAHFTIVHRSDGCPSNSSQRESSSRFLMRKKQDACTPIIDKETVLKAYIARHTEDD